MHLITIFVAVADTGGLVRAARKMGVSPFVVTRAVNDLETSLGVRLLIRTTRVVRLNETGFRYAEDCRRILASLAEAEDTAVGTHGEPRGIITVTSPAWFGALYMMPIVTEYLARFARSQIDALWQPGTGTLLELAETSGLNPEFSCRGGSCGTCVTALIKGKVRNTLSGEVVDAPDQVLICSMQPASGSANEGIELDL